jgi:hypothetical protein
MNEGGRILVSFAVLLSTLAIAGCGRPDESPPRGSETRNRQSILAAHRAEREQATRRFERAAFLMPERDSQIDMPWWMAVLIVEELGDVAPAARFTRFGRVTADENGSWQVETEHLTVYQIRDEIDIGDRTLPLLTSLWFYPPPPGGTRLRYRGVRMVLDERGYAIVWEILSSEAKLREFYVSRTLEQAAREAFQEPLPGRRFCVEPALDAHPRVFVTRTVPDGPQPMGPFVYLDRPSLAVTNLICRCEPAQTDAFPQSTEYRLVLLDSLAELTRGGGASGGLPLPSLAPDLERVLRFPPAGCGELFEDASAK